MAFGGFGLPKVQAGPSAPKAPSQAKAWGLSQGSVLERIELCATDIQTRKRRRRHLRQALGHPRKYPPHPQLKALKEKQLCPIQIPHKYLNGNTLFSLN